MLFGTSAQAGEWTDDNDQEESATAVSSYEEGRALARVPGEDDQDADESIDEEEEALALSLDWSRESERVVWPQLEIAAPDAEGLEYLLQYRLWFAGTETTWEDGPFEAVALQVFEVDVAVPHDAFVSSLQNEFPSDLTVKVLALDQDGRPFRVAQAPPLKVTWDESTDEPTLTRAETWAAATSLHEQIEGRWGTVNVEWVHANLESE